MTMLLSCESQSSSGHSPEYFCSSFPDDSSAPPSSPLGGGRKKQKSELPIGPDPESLPMTTAPLSSLPKVPRISVLTEDRRRVWVHGPRPEYKKNSQRFNLPSRIIALLRPNVDIVILPGGHEPTREFWEFSREVLGLAEWQAMFTSGTIYNMDDDIDDSMVELLRATIVESKCGWTMVPYCVTPNFNRWASKLSDLNVQIFGDELEWVEAYGHKGALHRHVRSLDVPSLIEVIDPSILVAKGYTCSSVEDLLLAYRMMGCPRVVVKPIYGAAGEGIKFMSSEDELREYTFPMGDVCLEEHLDLDLAPDGIVLSPAMHYNEGDFVGDDLIDQIMKGTSYMGWRKSIVSPQFQAAARDCLRKFMDYTDPRGPGGVDCLSVNGRPFLSDLNTVSHWFDLVYNFLLKCPCIYVFCCQGRFNGCHGPKLFRLMHAPSSDLFVWKGRAPENLTAKVWLTSYSPLLSKKLIRSPGQEFWVQCVAAGCSFIPGTSTEGVFPLLYLRGRYALDIFPFQVVEIRSGDTNDVFGHSPAYAAKWQSRRNLSIFLSISVGLFVDSLSICQEIDYIIQNIKFLPGLVCPRIHLFS